MIELLPAIVGGATTAASYFVGLAIGKRNPKTTEHVHAWAAWIKVDGTKQERFCFGCGFTETDDPEASGCPPHPWGKWYTVSLIGDTGGQARDCTTCGIQELRSVTTGNKGINK